jgi:hypothetical protein
MKNVLFLLLMLCYGAGHAQCTGADDRITRKAIVGEWVSIDVPQSKDRKGRAFRNWPSLYYTFYANDSVDAHRPYYRADELPGGKQKYVYQGTKTKWRITNNNLDLFEPYNERWDSRRIVSTGSDTMVLETNMAEKQYFIHPQYRLDTMPVFDKIAFATSACFGSCPIGTTIIYNDGRVLFYGYAYTSKLGLYTGKITTKQYRELMDNFRKGDVQNLESDYRSSITDHQTVYITFEQQGKIYRHISDYANMAPPVFRAAYPAMEHLYESIKLTPVTDFGALVPYVLHFNFREGNRHLYLGMATQLLLFDYLLKGRATTDTFPQRFKMEFTYDDFADSLYALSPDYAKPLSNDKPQQIISDGRYYKIFYTKAPPVTIDIGFNFFETNYSDAELKE